MNKTDYNYTTGSGGGVDYMQLLTQGLDLYSKFKEPTQTGTQTGTQTATQPTNITITPQFQIPSSGYKDPQKSTITWNVTGGVGTPEQKEKKDNTFMFLGIGIAVLVISALAFLIIKKKGV